MSFTTPEAAIARQHLLYQDQIDLLRERFQDYVRGILPPGRVRAYYPYVQLTTPRSARLDSRLAYGFVPAAGTYRATLTRPDLFEAYYAEQFALLLHNHGVPLEIGLSNRPIPLHFALGENTAVEESLDLDRLATVGESFDLPDLAAVDDAIANGTYLPPPGDRQPLSMFTASRVDLSLQRLKHYTATGAEHFQHFVLFTNYQFYIDEFVRMGRAMMERAPEDYAAFVEPGNVVTRPGGTPQGDPPPRMPQMPAYHLKRTNGEGITLINIGVGPSNAKTGTVATVDDRNWELKEQRKLIERFNLSRAIALDMESATIAANGYRFRVPYGTLLCVSDKPMHGDLKLPGMANRFYRDRVDQHLRIGIRAMELLRKGGLERLHSRKLRSFADTAFR